ncbi:hypothetical protein GCM10009117_01990 [Gangjinia marincola]|uniref:Outer membrane protein beta-barrel domain-containing protein n=1 Tax=Gangjinia marincola TaxID=578463 RepID=A0ABN1MD87_9FLAO
MRIVLLALCFGFTSQIVSAQFIKEKSIQASIGLGLSVPYDSADEVADNGLFVQGELVLKVLSWIEIRPYAGVIWTNSDGTDLDGNPTDEKAESKAFLTGGKLRLRAPIPYVAPYVELGVGTSIGKFETSTVFYDIKGNGFLYHIPFSFGLELGKAHNVDIGFAYFFQPKVKQYVGAFAVGVSFQPKKWR